MCLRTFLYNVFATSEGSCEAVRTCMCRLARSIRWPCIDVRIEDTVLHLLVPHLSLVTQDLDQPLQSRKKRQWSLLNQISGADQERFVRGVQNLDFCFFFSHHILQRGEGVHTSILSGPPLTRQLTGGG